MSNKIGILGNKFKSKPIDKIHRFSVYNRGKFDLLPLDEQPQNLNFQINGQENEQVVVRLWKNEIGFYKGRIFYSNGIDEELGYLLAKEWIKRLRKKYVFTNDFEFLELQYM